MTNTLVPTVQGSLATLPNGRQMTIAEWNELVASLWYAAECPPDFPLRQIHNEALAR